MRKWPLNRWLIIIIGLLSVFIFIRLNHHSRDMAQSKTYKSLEERFYDMHPEFKGNLKVDWEEDVWTKDDDEGGNIVTITITPDEYHSPTTKHGWESDIRRLVQETNDGKSWKVIVYINR